jgi:hypothetical protein
MTKVIQGDNFGLTPELKSPEKNGESRMMKAIPRNFARETGRAASCASPCLARFLLSLSLSLSLLTPQYYSF